MTDEAALLAAILAHPNEDTPRLIYADWLDENGQPERAEFIRVQVERVRLTPDNPRYALLARREAALGRHRGEWSAPFGAVLPGSTVKFARGFVEQLTVSAPVLLANATEAWPLAPIRRVCVTRSGESVPELSRLPRPPLVRLTAELIDDDHLADNGAFDLLRAAPVGPEPWLQRGRWLALVWPSKGGEGVRAVTYFAGWIRRRGRGFGFGQYNFAARPLGADDDPRPWCSLALPSGEPNWLLLQDGAVIAHQGGATRIDELQDTFWEPVGGPPPFAR